MAGVLSFTLGLETSNFLRNLGVASGGVLSLAAVGNGVQAAFTRLWGAVQQGGNLKDLADAASVSVGTLYQLRRGFEEVGGSADSVGSVLQRLRSNLAGGQQDNVLASLGLDPESLRRADPVAQMEQITAAMSRLDATSRARVGMNLFGREGAQVASQIANSGDAFATAVAQAAEDARIWQRVAHTFDEIADKVVAIRRHMQTMWAATAGALIKAWQEGNLDTLIGLTFEAGMERALMVFNAAVQGMAEILAATLGNGKLWSGMIEALIASFVNLGTSLSEVLFGPIADLLGDREGFDARQQERRDYAARQGRDAVASLTAGTREAMPAVMSAVRKAWADATAGGVASGQLQKFVDGLLSRMDQGAVKLSGTPEAIDLTKAGRQDKANFNELEKMGFVFGNAGAVDYGRDTATNTRKTNELLARIETKLGTSSASFANS